MSELLLWLDCFSNGLSVVSIMVRTLFFVSDHPNVCPSVKADVELDTAVR